jgi:HSP20 family protein
MLTLWRNHTIPFAALSREVDRLVNDVASPSGGWSGYGIVPAADVAETEAAFKVVLDLPGLDPKAIQIRVEDDVLTVQAERKLVEPAKDETVHRSERSAGVSFRSFTLPASVDAAKVEASYENGVLSVVLPKREEARARTIPVNAK